MKTKSYIPVFAYLTIEDVDNAKKELEVGDMVSFTQPSSYGRRKTIKGTITDKYEHIFMLDNGRSYQYVGYVTGGGIKDGGLHAM